jgi:hypothetical protein
MAPEPAINKSNKRQTTYHVLYAAGVACRTLMYTPWVIQSPSTSYTGRPNGHHLKALHDLPLAPVERKTRLLRRPFLPEYPSARLEPDPVDAQHDIHALLLRAIPLVAERAVLVRVPERADGAVHASTTLLCELARVLDYCAVGDVFVGRPGFGVNG